MCCSFFSLPLLRYQNFLGFKIYFDVGNDAPGWNEINSLPPPLPPFFLFCFCSLHRTIYIFVCPLFFFFFFSWPRLNEIFQFALGSLFAHTSHGMLHPVWLMPLRCRYTFPLVTRRFLKYLFIRFIRWIIDSGSFFFFFPCKTPISNRLHYLVERIFL